MTSREGKRLKWTQRRWIPLPPEEADELMVVRRGDFERIRRNLEDELSPRWENFAAAYYAFFGMAVATGAAVPPLLTAIGLPSWISPTFVVLASTFLVLGLTFVLVDRILRKRRRRIVSEISQEMRRMEEMSRKKSNS